MTDVMTFIKFFFNYFDLSKFQLKSWPILIGFLPKSSIGYLTEWWHMVLPGYMPVGTMFRRNSYMMNTARDYIQLVSVKLKKIKIWMMILCHFGVSSVMEKKPGFYHGYYHPWKNHANPGIYT